MEPGTVGIKFQDDGQITSFTDKAQQALSDAGVDENWKIIKVGSKKFTKKLLIQNARGSENYTMEFVYTGNRLDVTKWIFGLVKLFWHDKIHKTYFEIMRVPVPIL